MFPNIPSSSHRLSSQSIFHAPASPDSVTESVRVDSIFFSPLRTYFAHTIHRVINISSGVLSLFLLRNPAAVAFTIWAVIISSIQLCALKRRCSHVILKCCKAVFPLVTNCNAPATIVLIRRVFGIATPVPHVRPAAIVQSFGTPMIFSFSHEHHHSNVYHYSKGVTP